MYGDPYDTCIGPHTLRGASDGGSIRKRHGNPCIRTVRGLNDATRGGLHRDLASSDSPPTLPTDQDGEFHWHIPLPLIRQDQPIRSILAR
jgi:hypothetical protein